jgi:hypothetical protein
MRSTAYKKPGAPDRRSLIQQKLSLFTRVAPRTKARGSGSAVPYSTKIYAFYMRSTAYKKQEAPDWRFLTQQKFSLFTCVAPRTKSKGLPIGGHLLSKNLCFLHA